MQKANVRRRAAQGASDARRFIVQKIEQGVWTAGDRIPTERELSERFGLARNTLRRGLDGLLADGYITRHVGKGSFVAARAGLPRPIIDDAGLDLAQRIVRASPADVMELRFILELQAVERAAIRATGDDITAMQECLDRSEAALTVAAFEEWDGALHERIVAAARNDLLNALYRAVSLVRTQAEWGRLKRQSLTKERRQTYQVQHRAIVSLIRKRDGKAASAKLKEHLQLVTRNLLGEN
jgi:DNA-binding FadR family transcriptional regulator